MSNHPRVSPLSAAYIVAIMLRNTLMGAALLASPQDFTSPAFKTFFEIFSAHVWGVLLVASASLILAGLVTLRTVVTRFGLLVGSIVLFWVGISLTIAIINGIPVGSLWGPVIYAWLVISDFLLISSSFVNFVEVRVVRTETHVLPSSSLED